jgi:hypothetical protein
MARARVAALVALVCCVLLLPGCAGGNVTTFRLQKDAGQVSSIATDAAIAAHEASKGQTTEAYFRVHMSELGKAAGKLASVLGSAHPPARLAAKTRRLVQLARELSGELEQLENSAGDRDQARSLGPRVEQIAKQADAIGKSA